MSTLTTHEEIAGLSMDEDARWFKFEAPMGSLNVRMSTWGLLSLDWVLPAQDEVQKPSRATALSRGGRRSAKPAVLTWSSAAAEAQWSGSGNVGTHPTHHGPFSVDHVYDETSGQLEAYFSGRRTTFELPLVLSGTPFQLDVWRQLLRIPFGTTQSYGEVAQAIRRSEAVRAVGQANRANPVAIIVPCHRVIGSSGKLVGYAGANVHLKERLLAIEQGTLSPA